MHFIPLKKEPSNCSKFNLNSVIFVEGEHKNISCPRAQGTLATPLAAWRYILDYLHRCPFPSIPVDSLTFT